MRRQTEDIVRYYGELGRRISGNGVQSVSQLLELAKQVETAVADVGSEELVWVGAEIKRLLDELVHMDAQLQRLRELKLALGQQPESDLARRRLTV
jgi:hypothetical protein